MDRVACINGIWVFSITKAMYEMSKKIGLKNLFFICILYLFFICVFEFEREAFQYVPVHLHNKQPTIILLYQNYWSSFVDRSDLKMMVHKWNVCQEKVCTALFSLMSKQCLIANKIAKNRSSIVYIGAASNSPMGIKNSKCKMQSSINTLGHSTVVLVNEDYTSQMREIFTVYERAPLSTKWQSWAADINNGNDANDMLAVTSNK